MAAHDITSHHSLCYGRFSFLFFGRLRFQEPPTVNVAEYILLFNIFLCLFLLYSRIGQIGFSRNGLNADSAAYSPIQPPCLKTAVSTGDFNVIDCFTGS